MSISIRTDWPSSRNVGHNTRKDIRNIDPCVFEDMCCEERWYNTFSRHIQPKHSLRTLIIEFIGWQDIQVNYVSECLVPFYEVSRPEDRCKLKYWRGKLLDLLRDRMRGIKQARVSAETGLTRQNRAELSMLMGQSKDTIVPRKTPVKMSLSQVLAEVKAQREGRERKTGERATRLMFKGG